MKSANERLNDFIKDYKENWKNTIDNMKNYYDNEDEYWWVIGELLDRIVDLESKGE